MSVNLMQGDCLEKMRTMPSNFVDSIVTDPPYGLGFMGKKWDVGVPAVDVFAECLRVLKPGGHLLAFGGSRTYHRLAVAVEDGGFEIRDQIMWVYGQGFPKSQNVSKAIDKAAGAEGGRGPMKRGGERLMMQAPDGKRDGDGTWGNEAGRDAHTYTPATDAARQWDGWGTALKPAHEPIVVARKPLARGSTVAANVLAHGTGALNIDGCRVGTESTTTVRNGNSGGERYGRDERTGSWENPPSRFPANLIHDGSDEATASMGEASRFFYCAKASKKDRGEGNKHPTVKPCDLMRYLVRLVTPPGGTVLDPFMGSGTTGVACVNTGRKFVGIELDPGYFEIAERRIKDAERLQKESGNCITDAQRGAT